MGFGRALLLVLAAFGGFLTVPVAAQEVCVPVASAEVPRIAAQDVPFVAVLHLDPCAESAFHEVRAWIGTESLQASRVWNGSAWASSASYHSLAAADLEPDGRVVVALKANPDASQAEALLGGSEAAVWLRFRGAGGTGASVSLGNVTWTVVTTTLWRPSGDWMDVRNETGALVTAAPVGFDAVGWPTPPGFAEMAWPEEIVRRSVVPFHAGDVLVSRFAPALAPDSLDVVDIVNRADVPFPLRGLRVEDGSGVLHMGLVDGLPDVLAPGAQVRVSSAPVEGMLGDVVASAVWPKVAREGSFGLAKDGDGLVLSYGDRVLDVVAYGRDASSPLGWDGAAVEAARVDGRVFERAGDGTGWMDSDSAADWTRARVFRQYQQDMQADWFDAEGPLRAFVCPDRCFEEAILRIEAARSSLDVNLYDLSMREVVEALSAAEDRGVEVRVLLDPRPVGASAEKMDRIAWAVDTLRAHGADVRVHDRLRFDYDHGKYLVADGEWTFVVSENANLHGWPPDGAAGNRGWGVAVRDEGLGAWMAELFDADFSHPVDARAVTGHDLHPDAKAPVWGATPPPVEGRRETLVLQGPVRVRPAVAPDHLGEPATSPLGSALRGASSSVVFQQLNLPLVWSRPGYSIDSPLVAAMVEASGRGVSVRGIVADAFVDADPGTPGNDQTAAALWSRAPSLDVRMGAGPHVEGIVHNKGWIVDARYVFVGSANGNLASQAMNREVDLVIDEPRVAAYFLAVFNADHARAALPSFDLDLTPEPTPIALPGPGVALVVVFLLLAGGLRRSVHMAPRGRACC